MINLLGDFAAYLYCDARLVLGFFVGLPWERESNEPFSALLK